MTGNRVEELEATVRELQASINGLTDELVETKERLRYLEDQVGTDVDGIIEGRPSRAEARGTVDAQAGQSRQSQEPGEVTNSSRSQQPQQSTGQPSGNQTTQERQPGSQKAVEKAVQSTNESADVAGDEGKSDEMEGGQEDAEQSDDIIVA